MKEIRVLVVEDEVIIAQCLTMELELMGYDVCGYVISGEEAIIKTKKKNPDVILMDINLSGEMDGIDAAAEIIDSMKTPIIFCTGFGQKEIMERAEKINPLAYLRKPIIVAEVKSIIDAYFA